MGNQTLWWFAVIYGVDCGGLTRKINLIMEVRFEIERTFFWNDTNIKGLMMVI